MTHYWASVDDLSRASGAPKGAIHAQIKKLMHIEHLSELDPATLQELAWGIEEIANT